MFCSLPRFCRMREGRCSIGFAECGDTPPVPSALPPKVGLLVAGLAECEDMPPVPSALPPGVGRTGGFFNVGVLRQGASSSAVSFTRAPDANLDAQILAKKPTSGGQCRRHGGLVPAFCSTHNKKPTSGGSAERSEARPAACRGSCLLKQARGGLVLAFCKTDAKPHAR